MAGEGARSPRVQFVPFLAGCARTSSHRSALRTLASCCFTSAAYCCAPFFPISTLAALATRSAAVSAASAAAFGSAGRAAASAAKAAWSSAISASRCAEVAISDERGRRPIPRGGAEAEARPIPRGGSGGRPAPLAGPLARCPPPVSRRPWCPPAVSRRARRAMPSETWSWVKPEEGAWGRVRPEGGNTGWGGGMGGGCEGIPGGAGRRTAREGGCGPGREYRGEGWALRGRDGEGAELGTAKM
jgi:hypothetical protein